MHLSIFVVVMWRQLTANCHEHTSPLASKQKSSGRGSKPGSVRLRALVIYLRRLSPTALCGFSVEIRTRQALSPINLAPSGVYLAARVTTGTGALLPHRFTVTLTH